MKTKYITTDYTGSPLQFTRSWHSIKCATDEADAFDTMSEARTALDWSGEQGGTVEVLPSANYAA